MIKLTNPLKLLRKREWLLWGFSVLVVTLCAVLSPEFGALSLSASLVGVTALIFLAVGHWYGQLMTIVFAVLYGVLSFFFRYYGEMLTYLGMTLPMAAVSLVTWLRNPYNAEGTVTIRRQLTRKTVVIMLVLTAAATALFGWLLAVLHTAQLAVSIVSVTTSFLAAYLTALRSPYYALAYAANDIVLIVLWVLAALRDPSCVPTVGNFVMFLCNDLYGFYSWKKRAGEQNQTVSDA